MARILGLDIGIGSCGWAVVDGETVDPATGEVEEFAIVACGARCFEVPEEPKTKELKNKRRRQLRGQRRVMRRRAQRIAAVRRLLVEQGLPAEPGPLPAGTPAGQVWRLRAEALERRLEPDELSRVLVHLAKHRGFKSASRRERANEPGDAGKMLKAATALDARSAGWRTVGEMLARDPEFADRKRNRPGEYGHTLLRRRVEEEAARLFQEQRRLGNPLASEALERRYTEIAFFQRPLQSSVELVGRCRFEPAELRAPRRAPSFELFRFLGRLNNLRLAERGKAPRALEPSQRTAVRRLFATRQKLTFKHLREALGLPDEVRFDGLPQTKDPEAATFADATGTTKLQTGLGEARFRGLLAAAPDRLDAAMTAIVFHETDEEVERELRAAGLEEADVAALLAGIESFAGLRGAGHISAKACRRLLPHLEAGHVYSEACRLAGYDHTALGDVALDKIPNPVVRKVIAETLKQVRAVLRAHGEPDLVHVEMARDIGKSAQDRAELYRAGQERGADKDRHRQEYAEAQGGRLPNDEELERYELWLEQEHHCLYSGDYISPAQLVATDNSVQVDHILPYSRSGDDGYRNKALVTAKANQAKRDRTLWEWFGESDPARWEALETRVGLLRKANKLHKEKARKLLMKSFAEREGAYRDRHLQDTRYAIRVFRQLLEKHWPNLATRPGGERRIFARPGAITAMVRRGLGLDEAKKSGALGDRDHALDAMIVAWTTESTLIRLTTEYKALERQGRPGHVPALIADRHDRERLRRMFLEAAEAVFVSRPETRRGRGPAHDATLYGFERTEDGEVQYERKAVVELKPADLDRLKGDPARNGRLRETLAAWLARAETLGLKPVKLFQTEPPRMPSSDGAGPVIRNVHVRRRNTQSGIKIRRGDAAAHADLATMVRVDVFTKGGKFYLVPIYAWQVADKEHWPEPPMRAIVAHRDEEEWTLVDSTYDFRFSLYPGSYVEIVNRGGERFVGYFAGADRQGANLNLNPHHGVGKPARPGTRLLSLFRKLHVDRLGSRHEIRKEPREWRGEVCMSASAAG